MLSLEIYEIFLESVEFIMASRTVRGFEHDELVKLIDSVFDSNAEDSETEDVQELKDNFYEERNCK